MKSTFKADSWKITHVLEDGPTIAPKSPLEEIALEALGHHIRIRRFPDGTTEVLGLPKPKKAVGGLRLEVMEQVALQELGESGFTLESLRGTNDFQQLRIARRGVILALRKAGATFPQMGSFLNRSHSTIIQTFQGSARRRVKAGVVAAVEAWAEKPSTSEAA